MLSAGIAQESQHRTALTLAVVKELDSLQLVTLHLLLYQNPVLTAVEQQHFTWCRTSSSETSVRQAHSGTVQRALQWHHAMYTAASLLPCSCVKHTLTEHSARCSRTYHNVV
jgi:hypothetical protein